MIAQLLIGVALTMAGIAMSAFGFWLAEVNFARHRSRLMRPPHRLRLFAVVSSTAGLVLVMLLAGVTLWATAFTWLHLFSDFETAFYFALVSYTTVGYGNVVPKDEWRLLGAMAAANGFINIGLLTTLLIEGLRHVREGYRRSLDGED